MDIQVPGFFLQLGCANSFFLSFWFVGFFFLKKKNLERTSIFRLGSFAPRPVWEQTPPPPRKKTLTTGVSYAIVQGKGTDGFSPPKKRKTATDEKGAIWKDLVFSP